MPRSRRPAESCFHRRGSRHHPLGPRGVSLRVWGLLLGAPEPTGAGLAPLVRTRGRACAPPPSRREIGLILPGVFRAIEGGGWSRGASSYRRVQASRTAATQRRRCTGVCGGASSRNEASGASHSRSAKPHTLHRRDSGWEGARRARAGRDPSVTRGGGHRSSTEGGRPLTLEVGRVRCSKHLSRSSKRVQNSRTEPDNGQGVSSRLQAGTDS
jgi:hypothetical protein